MKVFCISIGILLAAVSGALANREFLWGVTGAKGAPSNLYAINPANGKLLGKIGSTGAVNLTGIEVKDGKLYAVQGQLSPSGASNKRLYVLNKSTAKASVIATLDPKYSISDLALRKSDGVMFGFGVNSAVKKLLTIDITTGAITEIGAMNNIGEVSVTFLNDGTLCLVRTNGFFTMNPATGASLTGPFALSGATLTIDNFMDTSAAGTIYCGERSGNDTLLYTLDPNTRVTTLVGTVKGAALSGLAFDLAVPPVFKASGAKNLRTTKSSVKLKGTAKSLVPLTISTKGASAKAKNGKWQLKAKLKPGKNTIKLTCDDGLGQKKKAKVVVIRE